MTEKVAKYPGTCICCHELINPGDKILHAAGRGASHVTCTGTPKAVLLTDEYKAIKQNLEELIRKNPDNDFLSNVLRYLTNKGFLSEKQRAALARYNQPKPAPVELPGPDVVPAGRYAIDVPYTNDPDGTRTILVRVWRGRNANIVRCYLISRINDDGTQVERKDTLDRIVAAGPADAARRFGKLTHHCSRCNARLDNALSAILSVGPECIKHYYSSERVTALKASGRAILRDAGLDPYEDLPDGYDLSTLEEPV